MTGVWLLETPDGVMPMFKRLYYDTAASANPMSFGALMQLVTPRSVLLGTDFPFVPEPGMKATIAGLTAGRPRRSRRASHRRGERGCVVSATRWQLVRVTFTVPVLFRTEAGRSAMRRCRFEYATEIDANNAL